MNTLAKLTWQCRRGTRELDQLLAYYLKNGYQSAAATEQQHFQQLINLEDDALLALFFTDSCTQTQHQDLKYLVEKIRHAATFSHQ